MRDARAAFRVLTGDTPDPPFGTPRTVCGRVEQNVERFLSSPAKTRETKNLERRRRDSHLGGSTQRSKLSWSAKL
jgi:hypothetical protein